MRIEPRQIRVRDVFDGYCDDGEDGVFAYGGRLTVRPPYQREFVYEGEMEKAVIRTILSGFPLNIMYWARTGDDSYEVLDGQQRTLSAMRYLDHRFPIDIDSRRYYWDALPDDRFDALMDYEFTVYVCEGTESEKLDWFRVVNIAGKKLTDQELRNAVYTGPWLHDAKRHFSRTGCPAKKVSDRYIKGDPARQELLERALKGICGLQGLDDVTEYMSLHRFDPDAGELWEYFRGVFDWIGDVFPRYDPSMKGLDWCDLYNRYHERGYDSDVMAGDSKKLIDDYEVQSKKGVWEYLLSRDADGDAARHLNLRQFDERVKLSAYSRQDGVCPVCGQRFEYGEMEGDHIRPWSRGGETVPENCRMLCRDCNARKGDRYRCDGPSQRATSARGILTGSVSASRRLS